MPICAMGCITCTGSVRHTVLRCQCMLEAAAFAQHRFHWSSLCQKAWAGHSSLLKSSKLSVGTLGHAAILLCSVSLAVQAMLCCRPGAFHPSVLTCTQRGLPCSGDVIQRTDTVTWSTSRAVDRQTGPCLHGQAELALKLGIRGMSRRHSHGHGSQRRELHTRMRQQMDRKMGLLPCPRKARLAPLPSGPVRCAIMENQLCDS